MRSIEQILDTVCKFLNKNSIDYVIVGGFAVLFYGNPRTTMDIDYVIQLEDDNIPVLVKFLQENGFHADEYDMRAALKEKSHCTVEDKETMFRLDIKGVYTEMDERALRNKRMIDFNDIAIWIASPEDTIVNKLVFSREQDIKDALGILVRQYDTLDMDYLEKTTKGIGVNDALKDLKKKYDLQK
ncbi:MAG: nucleotidyltransferase [Euryarchaeota archaeon]|nr:nucleotidyltransferase [Euryarchaeota archaeon]MCG2734837.1 nucleotidyltransferase [Candidatus Methanoperedenaceae archaeon]